MSLFSRLTTPFASRTRNFEVVIKLDDPWRSYFPGDIVKGSVVVTVTKPVRVTHVTACLHGYVKVYKHAIAPGDGLDGQGGFLGTGRGRRGGEYLGNGFASLFEDESVLCGDGRLPEGAFDFKFELEFPRNLPSSIDFERGTITYMITATVTRPTTIAPVSSTNQRVQLLEAIDIGSLSQPKPKIISLEPISRRSRARVKPKNMSLEKVQTSTSNDPNPSSAAPKPSRSDTLASDSVPPLSPALSDISSDRGSSRSFPAVVNSVSSTNGVSSKPSYDTRSASTSLSDKTITATTELLRPGALPGDTVPIKIMINHTKRVQSPHGVVVTLYRQGRVDAHPGIPLGVPGKGKKVHYEDYYPKSKTGLGGLSLTSASSTSVFRKDLSQSVAPLVVDPRDMTAIVKTSIRIPEDVFPTITRVPGSMITFKYYIEVVIDLRGRLTSREGFLPRLNMNGGQRLDVRDEGGTRTTSWNGSMLDTDAIRREKSVVACLFEVVIGTKDSSRSRRMLVEPPTSEQPWHEMGDERSHEEYLAWQQSMSTEEYQQQGQNDYYDHDYNYSYHYNYNYHDQQPHNEAPTMNYIPPPLQPEEQVDEKTRLRRAEEMLLPSRPPEDEPGPSNPEESRPTAPVIDYNHTYDTYTVYENQSTAPLASAPSIDTIVPPFTDDRPPSAVALGSSQHNRPPTATDDKQELERQRLMTQASAPDMAGEAESSAPTATTIPSAPILTEEDEYHHVPSSQNTEPNENLPRYQR